MASCPMSYRKKGYVPSLNDHPLFIKNTYKSIVVITVYVNDILLTCDDLNEISSLELILDDPSHIKFRGQVNYFLGLQFDRVEDGMVVYQHNFG